MIADDIERAIDSYLICAIWAGDAWWLGDDGNPPTLDDIGVSTFDITDDTRAHVRRDIARFVRVARKRDLALWTAEELGHDFYLTRNGHGTGFWDRGRSDAGERLADIAQTFGEHELCEEDITQ